jgi:hypothetical protein
MEFKLTSEQIKVVSGIFSSLGHIFFASIVIPFIGLSEMPENISLILFGVLVAMSLWTISIVLSGEIKK